MEKFEYIIKAIQSQTPVPVPEEFTSCVMGKLGNRSTLSSLRCILLKKNKIRLDPKGILSGRLDFHDFTYIVLASAIYYFTMGIVLAAYRGVYFSPWYNQWVTTQSIFAFFTMVYFLCVWLYCRNYKNTREFLKFSSLLYIVLVSADISVQSKIFSLPVSILLGIPFAGIGYAISVFFLFSPEIVGKGGEIA